MIGRLGDGVLVVGFVDICLRLRVAMCGWKEWRYALARWQFWCQIGIKVVCVFCLRRFVVFCLVVFSFGGCLVVL